MNLEEAVEELGKLAFTSCQHERYAQRCLYCADTVDARRRSLLSRLVASVEEETLERAAKHLKDSCNCEPRNACRECWDCADQIRALKSQP